LRFSLSVNQQSGGSFFKEAAFSPDVCKASFPTVSFAPPALRAIPRHPDSLVRRPLGDSPNEEDSSNSSFLSPLLYFIAASPVFLTVSFFHVTVLFSAHEVHLRGPVFSGFKALTKALWRIAVF